MDVKQNPRPHHRFTRCCGNCKFFLREAPTYKFGVCILPEGPKMAKNPNKELKGRLDEFDPTYVYCVCDNHQWKPKGYFRKAIKYAKVSPNDLK